MRRFNAALTMFVFLRGRPVIEYYFGLKDAFRAANDSCSPSGAVVALPRPIDSRRAPRK